jgi:dipeptidase D
VRNKIPEDGHATFVVAPGSADALQRSLAATERAIREEYGSDEPGFKITLTETHRPALVLTPDETTRLLALIADLPHGVQSMSAAHNAVETSCNLAIARVTVSDSASAHFVLSGRSLITTGVPDLQRKIAAIAAQHGVPVTLDDGYPAWEPRADSPLLATARRTYETVYGHPANVTVVHAGVECGTIISRVPGLDAIAIGPLIEGAHTPRERVNIPSVATIWTFLTALLRDLAK